MLWIAKIQNNRQKLRLIIILREFIAFEKKELSKHHILKRKIDNFDEKIIFENYNITELNNW